MSENRQDQTATNRAEKWLKAAWLSNQESPGFSHGECQNGYTLDEVSHWMPLPEPPEVIK